MCKNVFRNISRKFLLDSKIKLKYRYNICRRKFQNELTQSDHTVVEHQLKLRQL